MKPKLKKRKIGRWDALEVFDDENDLYCICYAKEGGAIVSDHSLKKAEDKFIRGMKVADAVRKLLHYKEYKEFPKN